MWTSIDFAGLPSRHGNSHLSRQGSCEVWLTLDHSAFQFLQGICPYEVIVVRHLPMKKKGTRLYSCNHKHISKPESNLCAVFQQLIFCWSTNFLFTIYFFLYLCNFTRKPTGCINAYTVTKLYKKIDVYLKSMLLFFFCA